MDRRLWWKPLVLAVAIVCAGPARAQNAQFAFQFGSPGSGNGQFQGPASVGVTPWGAIVVADTYNHRIQVFDHLGNFLFSFGSFGSGNGQFQYPIGVTVTPQGGILVADSYNHRIQVFDDRGNFLFGFGRFGEGNGQFQFPYGVAMTPSGQIVVADPGNFRIQVFDYRGNFLFKFGSQGSRIGQFINPDSVAVTPGGGFVVADSFNSRIQVFDPWGNFLFTFGSFGTGNGQFHTPRDVAVTPSGEIVVDDIYNNRIQVFDRLGNFLYRFGSSGSDAGQFQFPFGVAVSPLGGILVADTNNNRIQVFTEVIATALALSDDFDDNTRAAKWGFGTIQGAVASGPSAWDSTIPVREQNQRLEITPRANASGDHYNGYVSAGTHDFTSLGASVEVIQTASGDITDTDLCVGIDRHNFYLIEVEYGTLSFTQVLDGARTQVGVSYNPSVHRFWRIRHDSATDMILFQTSSNGQSWATRRSVVRRLPLTAMKFELSAGTWKPVGAPGKAIFDNFQIQ